MKTAVRTLVALSLVVLLAAAARAEDKKPVKKPAKEPYAGVFAFPKQITLDEKQQAEVDALKKEYTPKLIELSKRENQILTKERRKAGNESAKTARAEGKKGKEVTAAVEAAWKLSADEQTQLKTVFTERGKLMREIGQKKNAVLTDAQKEQLKKKPKPKVEKKEAK